MMTQDGPPPIPVQTAPQRRRRLDRVIVLLILSAIAFVAWTIQAGPPRVGFRKEADIAEAGVTNVVAALVTVTEDARVTNLRECFKDPYSLERSSIEQTLHFHTDISYRLLRMGSRASLDLRPIARAGLYQGYIDLGHDPWGQQYYIYLGPLSDSEDTTEIDNVWKFELPSNSEIADSPPGSPDPDTPPPFVAWPGAHKDGTVARAVPAPAGLPFYVICAGPNGVLDQPFMNGGIAPSEGDDITSWDGYAWEVVRGNRE